MNSLPQTGFDPDVPVGPLSILLAEDHVLSQTITVRLLQAEGHEVFAVSNGLDAVAACRDQQFDFVLMDLRLPGMGGLEAIRAIRDGTSSGRERPLQIWALTADSGDEVVCACVNAGADGHLAKPLKRQQLSLLLQGQQQTPPEVDTNASNQRETILSNVGYDRALATSLAEIFLRDFDSLLRRVQSGIQCHDFPRLQSEAHSLKSPARIFDTKKLHMLCEAVEQACLNSDGQQLDCVSERFLEELSKLRLEISLMSFDEVE